MPIKTYLDSGVIVAIARTRRDIMAQALTVLNDPDREFIIEGDGSECGD